MASSEGASRKNPFDNYLYPSGEIGITSQDQKSLPLLGKSDAEALNNSSEKKQVLFPAGSDIKTFLSFGFVSEIS